MFSKYLLFEIIHLQRYYIIIIIVTLSCDILVSNIFHIELHTSYIYKYTNFVNTILVTMMYLFYR